MSWHDKSELVQVSLGTHVPDGAQVTNDTIVLRCEDGHSNPVLSNGIDYVMHTISENATIRDDHLYLPQFGTDKLTECSVDQGITVIIVSESSWYRKSSSRRSFTLVEVPYFLK